MAKAPLSYASTEDDIWNAPIRGLAHYIYEYKQGPRTDFAKVAINARISRRLLIATWVLVICTMVLLVATVALLAEAP